LGERKRAKLNMILYNFRSDHEYLWNGSRYWQS